MLIAHAASTCDVCLEVYHENCSYHSIPCGHVFCLPCLVSTSPPRCPLCRHEFTSYTVRKVHLTLPSERDMAARRLELKLVQSSPDMTLAESLTLFQEVQEWLEGEAQDEFLVLRAFAAVMCGFHETKDKLLQTETHAEKNEALLLRSLDEARSATIPDKVDYKAKYQAVKSEVTALRVECTDLLAQVEQAQQRNAEIQAHYAQAQAYAQSQPHPESVPTPRRISNPLPAPPRPIEIPFLKLIEAHPSFHPKESKGKAKDTVVPDPDVDPMTSAFVPTLASITTRNSSSSTDMRSEVTTLVFKPPKRMPVWDSPNTSYVRIDAPGTIPHSTYPGSSSRPDSFAEAKGQSGEYSRTSEHPDVAHEPSSSNLAQSDNAVSRAVSYVADAGQVNPTAGSSPSASDPPPQSHASENDEQHTPRPPLNASARPISYETSPRSTSRALRETPSTSFTRSMVPAASRSKERGILTSGANLRRASSPVIIPSTMDTRMYSNHVDWQRGDARDALVRAKTRGATGDGLPHRSADGRSGQQHASSPRYNRRRMDGLWNLNDDLVPKTPDEYGSSRRRETAEFPSSPRTMEQVHPRRGTLVSHDAQSLAQNGVPRAQSPATIRERAHSHSHSYDIPPVSLNRRNAGAVSSMSGRLPLDLSIAGPGATFPMMDNDRSRAVPVAEV